MSCDLQIPSLEIFFLQKLLKSYRNTQSVVLEFSFSSLSSRFASEQTFNSNFPNAQLSHANAPRLWLPWRPPYKSLALQSLSAYVPVCIVYCYHKNRVDELHQVILHVINQARIELDSTVFCFLFHFFIGNEGKKSFKMKPTHPLFRFQLISLQGLASTHSCDLFFHTKSN